MRTVIVDGPEPTPAEVAHGRAMLATSIAADSLALLGRVAARLVASTARLSGAFADLPDVAEPDAD
jgi:hypothetical protein